MKIKYESAKITEEVPLALLSVERLNLKAPVYLGTHRKTLDRGLGVIKGTTHPGEVGNIAISGHRDSFFRVLKDIKLGDRIEMQTPEGLEDFEVSEITIVDALEVSVLDPADTTVLTLITCHPFYYQGYAPDRYIVKATPVDADATVN
jgi:sortase A